ncbi:hypothetical protein DEO72_LG6g1085 [Vigna unguiculata]|uniref:Uncharacterized protein n=1 Tax=Vigna unguiculata TaxID=3917 RepID=A0A4D6M6H6_VIGUN|nr:hypothetical protein DEO72_LG6g1085 [Vigna unguiculata]
MHARQAVHLSVCNFGFWLLKLPGRDEYLPGGALVFALAVDLRSVQGYWNGRTRVEVLGFRVSTNLRIVRQWKLGATTWIFSWVLVCRLAASSLPPGDDGGSGRMECVVTAVVVDLVGSYWYSAWRSTEYCQAVALVGESYALSGAWRHGVFRQAVAVRQWRWKCSDAWRSPFLFVCGDDRVIRYTGADVDTGGAEDVQMAERWRSDSGAGSALTPGGELVPPGGLEQFCLAACGPSQAKMLLFFAFYSPFLFVCGDDRVIRYTGADVDTGGAEDVQMAE